MRYLLAGILTFWGGCNAKPPQGAAAGAASGVQAGQIK